MNNEEIIKGLESVKKECGIHLDESFAWICEPIDKAIEVLSKKCHNENHDYAGCDQFVCSNCGIELQDWHQVERDEDDGDITYHEYEFRFCPNCGAKLEV